MSGAPALLGRRAMLLGGTALAASTVGCGPLSYPATEKRDGLCLYDPETPISGEQANCDPTERTPRDLAWHLRRMKVDKAWALSPQERRGGKGILIGHVDTGVARHREFEAGGIRWDLGYDFIDDKAGGYDPLINHVEYVEQLGHGTATASSSQSRHITPDRWKNHNPTCGGTTGPGRITGVAPCAELVPARAFRLAATGNLDRVAWAIDDLTKKHVHVITMALGWPIRAKRCGRQSPKRSRPTSWFWRPPVTSSTMSCFRRRWRGNCRGRRRPGRCRLVRQCDGRTHHNQRAGRQGMACLHRRKDAPHRSGGSALRHLVRRITHGRCRCDVVRASWPSGPDRSLWSRNLQQVFCDALVRTADKPITADHRKLLGAGIVNAKALLKENLVS